jgi:hypothetical protein
MCSAAIRAVIDLRPPHPHSRRAASGPTTDLTAAARSPPLSNIVWLRNSAASLLDVCVSLLKNVIVRTDMSKKYFRPLVPIAFNMAKTASAAY